MPHPAPIERSHIAPSTQSAGEVLVPSSSKQVSKQSSSRTEARVSSQIDSRAPSASSSRAPNTNLLFKNLRFRLLGDADSVAVTFAIEKAGGTIVADGLLADFVIVRLVGYVDDL